MAQTPASGLQEGQSDWEEGENIFCAGQGLQSDPTFPKEGQVDNQHCREEADARVQRPPTMEGETGHLSDKEAQRAVVRPYPCGSGRAGATGKEV
ncbi:hypothetical protein MA03_05020 [Infirmifilum uzonense]|uniref:Uncharacterized protein n=1 Tax=Infirmifilum uzonense TaxID=1550241 RepID=A0A0F7CL43_9CREN|nr:hypothetical protein MA03_05020 [Infirmifilum uzonense]